MARRWMYCCKRAGRATPTSWCWAPRAKRPQPSARARWRPNSCAKLATKVLLVHAQQTRPFRRVLACVDFSETSRVAVTQAMHVAAQERAELFFLHVFRGEWKLWDSQLQSSALADFEKSHQAILAHNLRRFTGGPTGGNATYAVTEANTHGAGIAEFAHQIKADLVVLGSKGRTNLKYVLLGSTVERLLKEIPCSALVVRSATAPGG
jgi:universal stress protein E